MEAATAHQSPAELLTLHAVRLKGMANDAEVAARFALERAKSDELLLDYEAFGWVTRVEFAGTSGWTLTSAGRGEDERRLAEELEVTGATRAVLDAYRSFVPLNGRLLEACTNWQLKPTPDDALAANDHSDLTWDQRVLAELATLGDELDAVAEALGLHLERFQGYDVRYRTALIRALNGDPGWVARPRADSCHTVWMELHEDLLASLRLERETQQ
jgi:hypothetical protein